MDFFSALLVLRNLPSFLQLHREWPPKVGGCRERRSTTWSTLIWKTCKGMPLCRTADAILPILRSTALECGQYERDDKDIAWTAKQWLTSPTIRPNVQKAKWFSKDYLGRGALGRCLSSIVWQNGFYQVEILTDPPNLPVFNFFSDSTVSNDSPKKNVR